MEHKFQEGNNYTFDSPIIETSMAYLYKCRSKSGELFAAKRFDFSKLDVVSRARARNEVKIHNQLSHKNIVKFVTSEQTTSSLVMFLEYCPNGTLADLLSFSPKLPEAQILKIVFQVSEALTYLHDRGVLHRDIKPENILIFDCPETKPEIKHSKAEMLMDASPEVQSALLFQKNAEQSLLDFDDKYSDLSSENTLGKKFSELTLNPSKTQDCRCSSKTLSLVSRPCFGPYPDIKLCDFSWACETKNISSLMDLCGSFPYMSPEVVECRKQDGKIDVWSLGVLALECLAGGRPVEAESFEEICLFFRDEEVRFPKMEGLFGDLIRAMLQRDRSKRLSAKEVLSHPVFHTKMPAEVNLFEDRTANDFNAGELSLNFSESKSPKGVNLDDQTAEE